MTRYRLTCTLLGLVLGWVPMFLHGPIPEKFDAHFIRGKIVVSGFYLARCTIGFLVGITAWPQRWYLRGPLCGVLMLLPLTFVSLATPECGPTCMCWNLTTAAAVGTTVAGLAHLVARKGSSEATPR